MLTKKSAQAATKESEIGIKVEETSLQTNTGTAAIEADIQIGIVMAEKDLKVYKSTKTTEGVSEIGFKDDETSLHTKKGRAAIEEEKIEIPFEEICISTNESAQTASRGHTGGEIGNPFEKMCMITTKSAQAAIKGNWDFKESEENIAVRCTNINCKTELYSGSNFCHICGQEINKKQGPSTKKDIQTDENVASEHDVKQDPGDTKTSIENEATVSHQAHETKVDPTDIKKMLQEKLQKDGLKKTQEYIERVLNSHRQNPVRLAVSGRSHVGKSTFINTMRGSKKGDKSYAKSGHGNTTMEVTKYPHPKNDMIIFYDLPGFGSLSMTKEFFLKQVIISDFDYFFIMFDSALSEDDAWFIDQIKTTMTPFCLVCTKLDLTLSKDEAVGDTVIQNIRQSHLKSLEDRPDLQKSPLFIISSDQPHIGEMTLLIDYMENCLSDAKWDAIIYFIPMITESVIRVKYKELCKRIPLAAFVASVIPALPIPLFDIGFNMLVITRELQCFIDCFQLNSMEAKAVLGVNYRWAISDFNRFILIGLKAVINSGTVLLSEVEVLSPIIGSAVSGVITFQYLNVFLKRNLDQMKRDADIVFKHTVTKMWQEATTKAVVHDVIKSKKQHNRQNIAKN